MILEKIRSAVQWDPKDLCIMHILNVNLNYSQYILYISINSVLTLNNPQGLIYHNYTTNRK